jgi:3-oxoacyl-[acyl-carrier protein] reductase
MDLGISGYWALVCGASRGLGRGCAQALAADGVNLVLNARGAQALDETAHSLRNCHPDIEVHGAPGDITDPSVRERALAIAPRIDILITNAGGPPPGDFRDWTRDDWLAALDANMLTPIELIKACVDAMAARGFGRVVNITSGAVKAPIDVLGLSNGARSGLTGFIAGLARQPKLAGRNVTINNLLPGAFDTERLHKTLDAAASKAERSVEDITAARRAAIPAGRFGSPEEFGAFCALLCSCHAGYFTGQNVLIDGGAYPGVN